MKYLSINIIIQFNYITRMYLELKPFNWKLQYDAHKYNNGYTLIVINLGPFGIALEKQINFNIL